MGDALLTVTRWMLGVGLVSVLGTGVLLAVPTLRRRVFMTLPLAVAWTFTWLALGVLLRAWANQEVWGQPWHWTGGEAWSLVALLALLGTMHVSDRWRQVWLSICLLAAVLALIGLAAS